MVEFLDKEQGVDIITSDYTSIKKEGIEHFRNLVDYIYIKRQAGIDAYG